MILFFWGDFVTFQGRTSQTSGGYVSYFIFLMFLMFLIFERRWGGSYCLTHMFLMFQWCCFFCLTVWHTCDMWVLTQEWSIPLSRIVSLIAGGILRGDWDAPSRLLKLLVGIDGGMLCHVDDQWQMMTDCQTLNKNERELIMPIFQEKETSTFSHCLMGVNHRIHRKMD